MSRRRGAEAQSRYGLVKNYVTTNRTGDIPRMADPWLELRDEYDGMLFDTLDALQAGIIDRKTFDREKARLMVARRKADSRFEHAVRQALKPRPAQRLRRRS